MELPIFKIYNQRKHCVIRMNHNMGARNQKKNQVLFACKCWQISKIDPICHWKFKGPKIFSKCVLEDSSYRISYNHQGLDQFWFVQTIHRSSTYEDTEQIYKNCGFHWFQARCKITNLQNIKLPFPPDNFTSDSELQPFSLSSDLLKWITVNC